MTMTIDDSEFLDTKLQGYALIKPEEIKAGDHLRVTQTVYKEPDRRKCGYVIVKKIVQGVFICNGYVEQFADWGISPDNKYKKFQFYKKVEIPFTGKCSKCNRSVKHPYRTCYDCRG